MPIPEKHLHVFPWGRDGTIGFKLKIFKKCSDFVDDPTHRKQHKETLVIANLCSEGFAFLEAQGMWLVAEISRRWCG
jgi:hypothetical protein